MAESIELPPRIRRIRDAIVVGFVLTLSVLISGAIMGYTNGRRLNENSKNVAHSHEVIEALESLVSTVKDAETGQRGYLLTEDKTYLRPYNDALRELRSQFAQLRQLTSDNGDQQSRLANVEQKVDEKLDELKQTITLADQGDRAGALKIVRTNVGNTAMHEIRNAVSGMQSAELELLRKRAEETRRSYVTTNLSILIPAIIGVLLVGAVFQLSQRNIRLREQTARAIAEQGERLRTTLASIGDAVIATDIQTRITNMNPVAESLTGWKLAEALGQPLETVFRIVNEHTRRTVENPVTKTLREGVKVGLANHTLLIAKDGSERAIDDSSAPIRCKNGEVVGCVLVFRDISERRRLERAEAKENEAARFLASIVESSEDAIITKSLEGIVQTWNASAERLFGYTSAEIVGRSILLIIPPDRQAEEEQILARLRGGGRISHFDTVRLRKDGRTVDVSLTISPIRDKAGRVVGASKIARDITERKESEQRIYSLMTELKEADQRKDEFLAMLAHELRGPLAPIRNTLEIIKRSNGEGDLIRQGSERMERQLDQLVRLVDDLLDLSRITSNKMELRKGIELASVIHQAIEVCQLQLKNAGHALTVFVPPQPIYVDADPVRLSQVFCNLLSNSAKYTDPGGEISLTVEREGSDAVVSIKDTGVGIPSDKLDTVFEMFVQVDRSLERSQGGLGIGLTLVKRLVELHGGSVEARSEGRGRGSEFKVRLPIIVDPSLIQRSDAPTLHAPAAARRILVVDDNHDSAESLSLLLQITGNHIYTAHDGLEAVEAAERFRPDVVLLDIGLPKLNGYQAATRIREQPWGKQMILVALTGWGQEEDRRRSKEAGFNGHLVKPVEYGTLMKLLAEL